MPKNKTLIADIGELAATLELEVPTEGLNNEALVALKKELKSQAEAKAPDLDLTDEEPKADEPKADEPKADEPKADEPKAKHEGPVVAPGKSLITKRGVLTEGAAISASDLGGGENSFKGLIKSGHIVR